ncbi:50S ribosomal protein L11 methyltransferase [Thermoclostridium stercorarium]|uniref:50S ribosomal protein L11 methyltransferase n=1 Tax=Thermoclostridium stercorarium TaxID=1510 RepID=UPI0002C5AF29|nr:50S ribosomal protein L11 methyltransferase [Thermoclostridium stercorarium]AGI39980.1 ribosomal protein-lysine N-methyltransferase [Thermoclostridium stercorarium subsp. stercorarium DSM 8532]UZQ84971.1 50S ribosomal protein L11 methyltransferase [Thermoclostridium stercorarium]
MKWLEVAVTVDPEYQEMVSQVLLDQGVQGLEIVDPYAFRQVLDENRYLDYADDGLIESYGEKVIIKAYFSTDRDAEKLKSTLNDEFMRFLGLIPGYTLRIRDDSEWKDNWKKYYKTFKIFERVVIKPTWEDYSKTGDEVIVELEPGMAFGTGTHETTRMCAEFLDELVKGNEKVLDLGCGTGILGIIAAKLGASEVTCVDIDDAAYKACIENVRKNHVSDKVRVVLGELKNIETEKYDIIVVNIIADVILSLLPEFRKYSVPETKILLSGIIADRRDEIANAVKEHGYCLVTEKKQGEWVAMQICTDF